MKYFKIITLTSLLFLGTTALGVETEAPGPPDPAGAAPIDGAIALLALAGIGYGAYRKRKS